MYCCFTKTKIRGRDVTAAVFQLCVFLFDEVTMIKVFCAVLGFVSCSSGACDNTKSCVSGKLSSISSRRWPYSRTTWTSSTRRVRFFSSWSTNTPQQLRRNTSPGDLNRWVLAWRVNGSPDEMYSKQLVLCWRIETCTWSVCHGWTDVHMHRTHPALLSVIQTGPLVLMK